MNFVFTVYSVFFLVTTLASFYVALLAWQRRSVKGARELTWLMIAAGLGSFCIIFETATPTIESKILWSKLEYFGGIATPVLYLIFVLRFTGKDKLITTNRVLMLFIIPVFTFLLVITNEKHNLVWSGFSTISSKTNLMEYYHGIGFWIGYIAYTYLMLFLATIQLIFFILHRAKAFRRQGWIVLLGGIFPWLVSAMYLSGINPVQGLDLAPVSITLSGMLAAYAILNIRFLDLVPVARELLVETLQDGIIALDDQNRIQDINNAALLYLGIRNKSVIGLNVESSGASVKQLLNAVIKPELVDQVEIPANDEIKTFRIIRQPIKYQPGSCLVIIRDITERVSWLKEIKSAEERYRHLYTMFRLMADNTEDFLWAKDLNNQYIFCNKTMCERLLMAESVEEPIGKSDIFFARRERDKYPENPEWHTFGEICADSDTITLKERKPTQFDEFGNVKGKFLYLDVHKAPIWDENGNLFGVVGTGRDVTMIRQLESERTLVLESLRKSEEDLRKSVAEKNRFFSIIAHDLRSPFSGFLGLTELLADGLSGLSPNDIRKMASEMKNSASSLFRLIENLLQWASIEQGIVRFNPEVVQLKFIVKECLDLTNELAKSKDIEIICSLPEDIKIYADVNMLQTIIRNLVSNAVKFTPNKGKINLSARVNHGNSIEISIQDSGIGMSEAIIENLFQVNSQTNRVGTNGEPSTGLGLIICRDFIQKHGGELMVESKVGKGSTFSFILPNQMQPEQIAQITQSDLSQETTKKVKSLKILIAEDDETSGMLLSLALKPLSSEILAVNSGNSAVDLCKDNPDIDLIMMDVKMPGMDGIEATRLIRQFNKHVFIVAQTAFGTKGDRNKALEAGCNEYITKPLNIAFLTKLVQRYFDSQ